MHIKTGDRPAVYLRVRGRYTAVLLLERLNGKLPAYMASSSPPPRSDFLEKQLVTPTHDDVAEPKSNENDGISGAHLEKISRYHGKKNHTRDQTVSAGASRGFCHFQATAVRLRRTGEDKSTRRRGNNKPRSGNTYGIDDMPTLPLYLLSPSFSSFPHGHPRLGIQDWETAQQ